MDVAGSMIMEENENTQLGVGEYEEASQVQKDAAVKVVKAPASDTGMYKVVIIAKLSRYDKLRKAMNAVGVTGMTVTQVMGCGIQKGSGEKYRGVEVDAMQIVFSHLFPLKLILIKYHMNSHHFPNHIKLLLLTQ